jgi:hypothetical protein
VLTPESFGRVPDSTAEVEDPQSGFVLDELPA